MATRSWIRLLVVVPLVFLQLYAQFVQCAPTTAEIQQQQKPAAITNEDNFQQRHKRQIWNVFGGFDDNNFFGGFGDNPIFTRPGDDNLPYNPLARIARQRQLQPAGAPLIFSGGGNTPAPEIGNNNNVVFINNQPVVATMAPFAARTTATPQFLNCFGSCVTTSEYNPICASNQQLYQNEQKFDCARNCGADIQIVRRGSCEGLFVMQRG